MNRIIKSQKIYRIDHVPGAEIPEPEKYGILQSYEEYDRHGNLTLEIGYTRDGIAGDKSTFVYDDEGRVTESRIYGEDEEVLEHSEMLRDKDGRIVREVVHYLDGSADIRSFFYNEKGDLTGIEVRDDEGEVELSEKYFYEGGNMVKVERYDDEGELVFSQEDVFENGSIVHRRVWSSEEDEPYTLETDFSSSGNRMREIRYNSDGQVIERNIFEEDESKRIVRIIEENRQRKNTTEIKHDETGYVIYQKETDLHGELNHEVFRTYDEEGSLIKVTAEFVQKNTGIKRAYSLVYRYEYYEDTD